MSMGLYYANLGYEDNDCIWKMNKVVFNAIDFKSYLERVRRRLLSSQYNFTFKPAKMELQLHSIPDELLNEIEIGFDRFYKGEKSDNPIKAIGFDRNNNRLLIYDVNNRNSYYDDDYLTNAVYYHQKGSAKRVKIPYQMRFTINEIEFVGIEEDFEAEAKSFVYEKSREVKEKNRKDRPIKILNSNERRGIIVLSRIPQTEILEIKADMNVINKQIRALEYIMAVPNPYHLPLIDLLVSPADRWPTNQAIGFKPVYLDSDFDGYGEQKDFVSKSLSTPDLTILEGPPGSGKTHTLIEFIIQCIMEGKKVMMVASTHVAVDNILERISEVRDDGSSIMDRYGILPLRIGKEINVSEKVNQFCIDSLSIESRNKIRNKLSKIENRTSWQEEFYQELTNERSSSMMEEMFVDLANFVCGTTIGILQAPTIRNSKTPMAHFDVLILDEASKTTFQEFLVPALYAKKWVISGDPLQLAPYVDEVHIIESLRVMTLEKGFNEQEKEACLEIFRSVMKSTLVENNERNDFYKVIVLEDGVVGNRYFSEQLKHIERILDDKDVRKRWGRHSSTLLYFDSNIQEEFLKRIPVSNLVVVSRSNYMKIRDFINPEAIVSGLNEKDWTLINRSAANNLELDPFRTKKGTEQNWEEEVTWRLSRLYELKHTPEKKEYYDFQLKLLLPYLKDQDGKKTQRGRNFSDDLRWEIRKIQSVALPSVLDLLLNGFDKEDRRNAAIFHGMPESVLNSRHVTLTNQHRMHPDISRFPRENIYKNNALLDGKDVKENRNWGLPFYGERSIIIDVKPRKEDVEWEGRKNVNQAEVRMMMGEIEKLLNWFKNNPKTDGEPWKLAILTFYTGQEALINTKIRDKYNLKGARYFQLDNFNSTIDVCTVDRFQGHEADIVLLSFVRSRLHRGIGFLDNKNRLNVAITRARFQLISFADKDFMSKRGTNLLKEFFKSHSEDIHYGG